MEVAGFRILDFYGLTGKYDVIGDLYNRYNAWAVGIAGFTPIPYKVFTISAGAFRINFPVFLIASAVSRSARFFLVGWLIYLFGEKIKSFIDNYFNILTIVFALLLAGGFVLVKWLI
jgi:membrane protein DedA with SNARE-associated domain